jgi:hypothetical protein
MEAGLIIAVSGDPKLAGVVFACSNHGWLEVGISQRRVEE